MFKKLLLFLSTFIFLNGFLCLSLANEPLETPTPFSIEQEELEKIAKVLVVKVDAFKAIFRQDTSAIIYGGAAKSFTYWIASHFKYTQSEDEFNEVKMNLINKSNIKATDFLDSRSDIDVISNKIITVSGARFHIDAIQQVNKDRINIRTRSGLDEVKQGYIPVEKIALGKQGFIPLPQFGNPLWEIISGKITIQPSLRHDFWSTYYARKKLNHPILLALRYLRLASLDYYFRYGNLDSKSSPLNKLDENSVDYVKDLIQTVAKTGELTPFLKNPQILNWIRSSVSKAFTSFANVTASDKIMRSAGFGELTQAYADFPPYNTFTYTKFYDLNSVDTNLEEYEVDQDNFYIKIDPSTEPFFLYHGTQKINQLENILKFGNLPSTTGVAGKGTYAANKDEIKLAINWGGGEAHVAKLQITNDAKIVDIRYGEGKRVFNLFAGSYEDFSAAFGVDIIRYSLMGYGAYVIKNGGVVEHTSPYKERGYTLEKALEETSKATNFNDIYKVIKRIKTDKFTYEQIQTVVNTIPFSLSINHILDNMSDINFNNKNVSLVLSFWANRDNILDEFTKIIQDNLEILKLHDLFKFISKEFLALKLNIDSIKAILNQYDGIFSIELFDSYSIAFKRDDATPLLLRLLKDKNYEVTKKTAYSLYVASIDKREHFHQNTVNALITYLQFNFHNLSAEIKLLLTSSLLEMGVSTKKLQSEIKLIMSGNLSQPEESKNSLFSTHIIDRFLPIGRLEHFEERFKNTRLSALKRLVVNTNFEDFATGLQPSEQAEIILKAGSLLTEGHEFIATFYNFNTSNLNKITNLKLREMLISMVLEKYKNNWSNQIRPEVLKSFTDNWFLFFKSSPEIFIKHYVPGKTYIPFYYLIEISMSESSYGFLSKDLLDSSRGLNQWLAWLHYLNSSKSDKDINLNSLISLFKNFSFAGFKKSKTVFNQDFSSGIKTTHFYTLLSNLLNTLKSLKNNLNTQELVNALIDIDFENGPIESKELIELELRRLRAISHLTSEERYNIALAKLASSKSHNINTNIFALRELHRMSVDQTQAFGQSIIMSCINNESSLSKIFSRVRSAFNIKTLNENFADCLLDDDARNMRLLSAIGFQDSDLSLLLQNLFNKRYEKFTSISKSQLLHWIIQTKTNFKELELYLANRLSQVIARAPKNELIAQLKIYPHKLEPVLESLHKHRNTIELVKQLLSVLLKEVKSNPTIIDYLKEAQQQRQIKGKPLVNINSIRIEEWIRNQVGLPLNSNHYSCKSILATLPSKGAL